MGILDRIFGSDDPIEKEIEKHKDEEDDKDLDDSLIGYEYKGKNWPPESVLYGEEWPYEFVPVENNVVEGKEISVAPKDPKKHGGTDLFMGKDIRNTIESRYFEEEKKAPTRVGYTEDNIQGTKNIHIEHEALFKHMVLFGTTGYGKSTLMKNIMLQWIYAGFGLCFIDPKGEDSKELIQSIPPNRVEDVIWVQPGNPEHDYQIGFNAFETSVSPDDPVFDEEAKAVAANLIGVIKNKDHFGPQIENITELLMGSLIKSEHPYNLIDYIKVLKDEEERRILAENHEDELEKAFLERIVELDKNDTQPIWRRVRKWVDSKESRQILAQEKSNISINEAVNDQKILILNTQNIHQDDTEDIVTRMIIKRIWSTVKARKARAGREEVEPYFLCVDEFNDVVSDTFDIEDIISKGRSFKISIFVANQQPSQLGKEVKSAVQHVQTMMTFSPGKNQQDQHEIANAFGDIDPYKLDDLDEYRMLVKPYMNGSQQKSMKVKTFPEYPPLRSMEEAEKIIEHSIKKYGVKDQRDGVNLDNYGPSRFQDKKKQDGHVVTRENDTVTNEQILESLYAVGLKDKDITINEKDGWVTRNQIKQEINKYIESSEDINDAKLSNALEKQNSTDIENTINDGKAYYRLTEKGREKAFSPDTGEGAKGGRSKHRIMLEKGYEIFTKLGYNVRLPAQDEGGKQPDGIGRIPIDPMKNSTTFEEALEKEKKLLQNYPRLTQLFGSKDIAIEAESTTLNRPGQTISNLSGAIENNQHCVFLVNDGSERGDFEYFAKRIINILEHPAFIRNIDENGNRTFYSGSKKIGLSNGGTPLVKNEGDKTERLKWKEHKDSLHLISSQRDEPITEIENIEEIFSKPIKSHFPYYYVRDRKASKTVVKNRDGEVVDTYENLGKLNEEKKYRHIYQPLIPERKFPNNVIPDEDAWSVVILPSEENKDIGPQIYNNGSFEPLLIEDGGKVDLDEFDKLNLSMDEVKRELSEDVIKKPIDKISRDDREELIELDDNNDSNNTSDSIPIVEDAEDPLNEYVNEISEDNNKSNEDKNKHEERDNKNDDQEDNDSVNIPQFPEKP